MVYSLHIALLNLNGNREQNLFFFLCSVFQNRHNNGTPAHQLHLEQLIVFKKQLINTDFSLQMISQCLKSLSSRFFFLPCSFCDLVSQKNIISERTCSSLYNAAKTNSLIN